MLLLLKHLPQSRFFGITFRCDDVQVRTGRRNRHVNDGGSDGDARMRTSIDADFE
jgi:hypothetical protein